MPLADMQVTSYYPVLMTTDVPGTATFWQQHFGFVSMFTDTWYVHLQLDGNPAVNLAVLDHAHPTVPESARTAITGGLLINFEVADVDAVYTRLAAAGLPMLLEPRDEDFGQRHFITRDPNGVLIDVITPIAPSAEYAELYASATPPGDG